MRRAYVPPKAALGASSEEIQRLFSFPFLSSEGSVVMSAGHVVTLHPGDLGGNTAASARTQTPGAPLPERAMCTVPLELAVKWSFIQTDVLVVSVNMG